ncbi:hypothetical protein BSL78_19245 [Apostichopus japonicus]|uniref:Uncharacterized protein n=1 Tax=Stichopus japonicus TaxID=307972 RepID=A0A2G8K7H1_STIJA|nr:hypothetical protein BSL78_19245 [Apostichopus japonicus]
MSELPIKGVSMMLGNDLQGDKVLPNPIVTYTPSNVSSHEEDEIYPACVMTRAMSKKAVSEVEESESCQSDVFNLEDTFFKVLNDTESSSGDNQKKFEEDFAVKVQFSSLYFGEGEEFLSPLRKFVTPGVGGYKADFGLTLVIFSRREVRLVLHSIVAGSPSSILEHRRKEGDCCFWDREKLRRGPVNFAVQRTENRRHQGRGR